MHTGPEIYDIVTKTAERRELSRPMQDEIKRTLRAAGLVWKCAECGVRYDPAEKRACHDQVPVRAADVRPGDLLSIRRTDDRSVIEAARVLSRRDDDTILVRVVGETASVLVVSTVGAYHSVSFDHVAENMERRRLVQRLARAMEATREKRQANVDARFRPPQPSMGVYAS